MIQDLSLAQDDASYASPRLDRVGTTTAILCAIHCTALPLLAALAPLASFGFAQSELLEWAFVIAGVVLGASALVPSFKRGHRRPQPLLLFATGMIGLLTARIAFEQTPAVEVPLAVGGALTVATAHLVNRRLGDHPVLSRMVS